MIDAGAGARSSVWARTTHARPDAQVAFEALGAAFTVADAYFGVFPALSEAAPA